MKQGVVEKLNNVNKMFYQKIGTHFDDTRNFYWKGWEKLLEVLPNDFNGNVLDIGCGNGRFGSFLIESFGDVVNYTGIDNSKVLLDAANDRFSELDNINLHEFDFVDRELSEYTSENYDLITIFGVMHHIPSIEKRSQLLKSSYDLLKIGGFLVFTTWNFAEDEKYKDRIIDWSQVGLTKSDIDPGDYLLEWKRGKDAIRYCHNMDQTEVGTILDMLGMPLHSSYQNDGKSGVLNTYYIIRKE